MAFDPEKGTAIGQIQAPRSQEIPSESGALHKDYAAPRESHNDPWHHRAANLRCRTCMWFALKTDYTAAMALGRCRRHAPTLSGYPAVFTNDWCGDHKLDENKI